MIFWLWASGRSLPGDSGERLVRRVLHLSLDKRKGPASDGRVGLWHAPPTVMKPAFRVLGRAALALGIVALGAGVMAALIASRPPAESKPADQAGVVVRTLKVKASTQLTTIASQGTVIPAREVQLQPEVPGRVVYKSPNLVPGGRFKKGEVLLRIDASEYALRAQQTASQLEQAEQQVKLEAARGEMAAAEWKMIGEDSRATDTGRAAALREPQRQETEARLRLAEQERDLASLNVGRTTLTAPFNGFVRNGLVSVGQYVSPAGSLGTLVGSDEFWVQVSVPADRLSSLKVPGFNAEEEQGSEVSVWQEMGSERIVRPGRVVRLYGDVDPVGRMARVLARIEDPLGLLSKEKTLPLLLDSYVHVDIQGQEMSHVVEVPRSAVHSGRFVYLFGPDSRLVVREVEIAWSKAESLLVFSGLKEGDEVITSRIGNAVAGLQLRRAKALEKPSEGAP